MRASRTVFGLLSLSLFSVGCPQPSTPTPAQPPPVAAPDKAKPPADPGPPGGCTDRPEVRMYLFAWNSQAGLINATGGKNATAGSLMCKNGVNLRLIREDNTDTMQSLLLSFAEELKTGVAQPQKGAHFVGIMGDGSATFLKGLNDKLAKVGPEYTAAIIASMGYSRGEDKFMGPPAWKADPKAARGGLVAGVLRDGDWNIAMKWLGDNGLKNNPDDTSYDPDAVNWVNATDYIEAAQKYVSGFCTELKNVKTGKKEKRCVDAVVTWTPGDVTIAEQKGGLVNLASTREYRTQMPQALIGNRKWMAANRELVTGLLKAAFAGADELRASEEALKRSATITAQVFGEKDAAYWAKYFNVRKEKDKQGLDVELGGSAVNGLAENIELFGIKPGTPDLFAATYTVFGNMVKSQYPDLLPSFPPVNEVVDLSYLKALSADPKPAGTR